MPVLLTIPLLYSDISKAIESMFWGWVADLLGHLAHWCYEGLNYHGGQERVREYMVFDNRSLTLAMYLKSRTYGVHIISVFLLYSPTCRYNRQIKFSVTVLPKTLVRQCFYSDAWDQITKFKDFQLYGIQNLEEAWVYSYEATQKSHHHLFTRLYYYYSQKFYWTL